MDFSNVCFNPCQFPVASMGLYFVKDLQREQWRLPGNLSPELPVPSERY